MTYWIAGAAAVGALVDRKQPLRGALLGAGVGLTGGAALGATGAGGAVGAGAGGAGILGAEAVGVAGAGATGVGSQAGLLAAQEAGLGVGSLGWGGATTGVQGGLNSALGAEVGSSAGGLLGSGVEAVNTYGPTVKNIANAAQTANSMYPNQQQQAPLIPPPTPFVPTSSPALAGLVQQNGQIDTNRMQEEMQRKQRQQQLIGRIGGY